ncbi:MAG: O-antigen ligase family protein, partial [Lachnospiraceae bacterium]|nr:O-antigen ligase family protein [Lachnospiraceae bacterium]
MAASKNKSSRNNPVNNSSEKNTPANDTSQKNAQANNSSAKSSPAKSSPANSAGGASHARHNKHQKNVLGKDSKAFKWFTLVPLIAVLGILPLIVRTYWYDCGLADYDFFDYQAEQPDFFLHGKMVLFLFLSFVMLCLLIAKLVVEKKEIRFSKIFVPLGVYGLLALLSSIFSDHQPFPWTGIFSHFESVFVLLGYIITAYYAFLFVSDTHDIQVLLSALAVSTLIMVALGISQAFFTDFFNTELGYKMIVPSSLRSAMPREDMIFSFQEGSVYLTLFNPNYVGSYAALLSPLFLIMVFANKKIYLKILYILMYVGVLIALFGSGSRSGFIGIGLSMLLLLVLFARRSLKFWIPVGAIAIVSLGVFMFYLKYTNSNIVDRFKEALDLSTTEVTYPLTRIETNDNDVVLTWKGNNIHLQFEPETLSFGIFDDSRAQLSAEINPDNNTIMIADERFKEITIKPVYLDESHSLLGFEVNASGTYVFARYNNTYYFFSVYGKLVKHNNAEATKWLYSHPGFLGKRGFIWAKTLPLLKDNIFLGSGADTFIFEFPGTDFLSFKNSGYESQVMTKPHNMYLQIGVQTGIISLIAFLAFYFMYLVFCIITSLKMKKHTFCSYVSGGIAAGTFGYMVTAIINDSTIAVAPLYWALLGIGLAACLMAR